MAKIRKIYDQTIKPDGSKVTIYPITSTRAVYTPESITMEALINEGYRFGGVIEHLEDSPEFTDQRVFYLADKVGVYPNFGNLTLAGGELGVFCYNKSQWIKGILKGGGTNLTGYQVVTSASLLPDEESTIGYIIGTNLYVWVGEGGDTKEGKYKNVGPFVGPQGNGIEQVFLSPTNYKLTIDFTDGTSWTSEQSIRGITGAKGDKGDPGLTGAAGATGPKGAKGDKGDSGVSLGEVTLTTNLDETETGKALDASAMQTIPHWVDEEQEIEDVPSNYYTKTQVDQKLLSNKAEVNQYLTNQDNDIARLEDRIDNMVDGVDEFIHHRPTIINNGTIINAPDDEDLVATEENTLKFADRPAINAMGYVILRKNKTFTEQLTKTNTVYEIRYDFDLDEGSVAIPAGCILKFVGGKITNGTLVGSNTQIVGGKSIFNAIAISGTWLVPEIYSWFFDDIAKSNKLNQLFALCNNSIHNTVYILDNGTGYTATIPSGGGSAFSLIGAKNIKIVLDGTVNLAANGYDVYNIFNFKDCSSIELVGSGTIKGDRDSHTYGSGTDEWGHCVRIDGCSDMFVGGGLTVIKGIGDGINIGKLASSSYSHDVIVSGVNVDACRRNGIVIGNAYNICIENANISNIDGTAPKYAIDIEPDSGQASNIQIRNITIDTCGGGIVSYLVGTNDAVHENLVIENIKVVGNLTSDSSIVSINNACTGIVRNVYANGISCTAIVSASRGALAICSGLYIKDVTANLLAASFGGRAIIKDSYVDITGDLLNAAVTTHSTFENCTLKYSGVDTTDNYASTLSFVGCTLNGPVNAKLLDSFFTNCTLSGEVLNATASQKFWTNVHFSHCSFDYSVMEIRGTDCGFDNCKISTTNSIGITSGTNTTIQDSSISMGGRFLITSSSDIVLRNNKLSSDGSEANKYCIIELTSCTNSVFEGNVLSHSGNDFRWQFLISSGSGNILRNCIFKNTPISSFISGPEVFVIIDNSGAYKNAGATADRPLFTQYNNTVLGFTYYDTTLGKKIMWNGTAWVNLDGTALE